MMLARVCIQGWREEVLYAEATSRVEYIKVLKVRENESPRSGIAIHFVLQITQQVRRALHFIDARITAVLGEEPPPRVRSREFPAIQGLRRYLRLVGESCPGLRLPSGMTRIAH